MLPYLIRITYQNYIDDESAGNLINNINNNYFYTNVTTLDTLVKKKKLIKLNY